MRPNRIRKGPEGAEAAADGPGAAEAERVGEVVVAPEVHLGEALEERAGRRVGALEERGARRAGTLEEREARRAAREEAEEGPFP